MQSKMDLTTQNKVDRMIASADQWLKEHDYRYVECNYVPERLFTRNRKINLMLRTAFRLLPFNPRSKKDMAAAPLTPHTTVAMLKAFSLKGDRHVAAMLAQRVFDHLQSPATKAFSLRQGIRVAVNRDEDNGDDPSPLNTVFFGEFLLDSDIIDDDTRRKTVLSICDYLVNELGYRDHGEDGIYFYYGHHLKDIIYNASAFISAFLIKSGTRYERPDYVSLGERGLTYIMRNQNSDGSWFYYGPPLKKAIDGFHQCYILKALMDSQPLSGIDMTQSIARGMAFYKTQFRESGKYLVPQRYDRRFNPKNTWLLQKIDGRDISEALTFFSLYAPDPERVEKLVNYMYDKIYRPDSGRLSPEIFIYGRNRNDYIEFYGWYLHALYCVKKMV